MKQRRLLHALGEVDPTLVAQAAPGKKKLPRWGKLLTAAACICLVLLSAAEVADRFEWFYAGCSANPGTIVGDTYYFSYKGDGVYSYSPAKGTKKELSTFWYEGWLVNDYGIYYKQDNSLYVKVHATDRTKRLYTADPLQFSHIGFSLDADGSVIVTQYNKHREIQSEVRVDGIDGRVLDEVTPAVSYDDVFGDLVIPYSRANFTVGARTVKLTVTGEEHRFILCENGTNILPEGVFVGQYPRIYSGRVWFEVAGSTVSQITWFILSPDGDDRLLTLPYRYFDTATGDFLFYTAGDSSQVWCMDYDTLECWALTVDTPSDDLYSLVTDGAWLYTCAPWDDAQTLWRLVYEDGRPTGLELVNEDIGPHGH